MNLQRIIEVLIGALGAMALFHLTPWGWMNDWQMMVCLIALITLGGVYGYKRDVGDWK